MAQNTKGLKGQGHTSRSSVKVTYLFYLTCVLLLLNKHKKFEDDAVARFCCSGGKSKWRKKTPQQPLQ